MRTQEDIAKLVEAKSNQIFSFTPEVLVPYLDFNHAKKFLKPDVTAEQWTPQALKDDVIKEEMREYMERIGWDKVEDHRGISAGRTVEKMRAWLWLLGDEEMYAFADDKGNYPQYGAPILKAICLKYGFPIPTGAGVERMMTGKSCGDDGCGCDW